MKKMIVLLTICSLLLTACGGKAPAGTAQNGSTADIGTTTQTTAAETQTGSTTAAAAQEKVSDYFPFAGDVHMTYSGTGNEYAAYETFVDYIKDNKMQLRKNNGGTEAVTVYTVKDGALVSTYARGGVEYKFDYTSIPAKEDILLKEPLEAGTSWTSADGATRSITAVGKQIATPAGTFDSIEVTTKGENFSIKDYYAKGIGLIKTEYNSSDGTMTVVSELEKVEKDVPFKRVVRFYYPQFDKDRIVYVEREVEIRTNEDIRNIFRNELKTVPESNGLSKTLTENTEILGILLDDEKDTVTVDLSSDFVKEMNAGVAFEGMLLDSVVNTFGNYYMKSKVIITIDGKPYESGHVLMKPGEAFDVKTDGVQPAEPAK